MFQKSSSGTAKLFLNINGLRITGGHCRDRTCGPHRVKVMLYRWAKCPLKSKKSGEVLHFWWSWGESNPWPRQCERRALPTELQPQILNIASKVYFKRYCWYDQEKITLKNEFFGSTPWYSQKQNTLILKLAGIDLEDSSPHFQTFEELKTKLSRDPKSSKITGISV